MLKIRKIPLAGAGGCDGRQNGTNWSHPGARHLALDTWLALRGEGEHVFVAIRRGGHITTQGMTAQAIYNVVIARCAAANVADATPHDFRRTFVSEMLDAGVDLATVATLAGHSNPATTQGYDRRGSRARQAAAAKLHWPGQ